MEKIHINIARDFSRCPGARHEEEGEFSGERFRDELLAPKVKKAIECGENVVVVFDGTCGFSTGFLEEAFGGLIRVCGIDYEDAKRSITFVSEEDPTYIDEIEEYMESANNSAYAEN